MRQVSTAGSTLILSLVLIAAVVGANPDAAMGSDTSTRWDSFSESSGCGDPYTRTPYVSKTGSLADSELILGPFGTYFGRSVADVRSHIVYWTVPGSGGHRVRVHEAMLPSLQQVAASLAAEAANGRVYRITSVGGFNARTIGGSQQLSRHALGLAIDINPQQNPWRADNRLITDMPQWFVDAWRSAGFCWGGDWEHSKDAMHFSWMGPGETGLLLPPLPSRTTKTVFNGPTVRHATAFAPVVSRYRLTVVDGTGNGAPDIVGVRPHPDGSVIDIATSRRGYGECSISRWFVPNSTIGDAAHVIFGDVDGDSGQDLIALSPWQAKLSATVASRRAEFEDSTVRVTGLGPDAVSVTTGDLDGDLYADLWEATPDGRLRVWRGPAWVELIHDEPLPAGAPLRIAAGDRDAGDLPELFALYPTPSGSSVEVLTFDGVWMVEGSVAVAGSPDSIAAIGAHDYDGDGRSDAQILDGFGILTVHIGNTPTGVPASRWFLHPNWHCHDDDVPLSFGGAFYDDEDSIFQANIEAIAAAGITRGCNPPFGDRFCPREVVTRETMAAFLVRALGLQANNHPGFADVPAGSVFAEDIGRLATAGITLGCTPAGDMFCPKGAVTREAMAAFLVRGLGLQANSHPGFADVPADSIFAEDIGRLATAGITLGCTPVGDMFCPKGAVTREAMSAFLDRAVLSSP